MRCNACWKGLEGRAVTTTCGHIFCTEDASKIVNNEAACPVCDQVLSKRVNQTELQLEVPLLFDNQKKLLFYFASTQLTIHMKPVDVNPNDEWTNMAMVGVGPQILMKSAYKSVMFYIAQTELEMQCKLNRVVSQCRQKCEMVQEKFTEKLEQVHTAYQKMAKRCQMLEQENENLTKDKQELQEKFAEKSRQKRKLDEMYDQLRSEYESVKRSAIQPASSFYPRPEPDLFSNPTNMMGNMGPMRKDWGTFAPDTPGPKEGMWTANQTSSSSFDIQGGSPGNNAPIPGNTGNRRHSVHTGFGAGVSNPSMTLRNLIISPIKRPQLSRNRQNLFTL